MGIEVLSNSEAIKTLKLAHTAATTAKTILLINAIPVIPLHDEALNVENVFVYGADIVRIPKATGEVWTGNLEKVYWDDTAKNFTKTVGANTFAGRTIEPAANGDTEGVIDFAPISNNA